MTDKTENHKKDASSSVQPGDLAKLLKNCREKAGLDLEKAAESMHLSRGILAALESENLTDLPEPPYVRGYLRSYAKLAEMDATPLIRTYEILRGADPDANMRHFAPATSINKVAAPSISPETLRMLLLTALIILLGLLSMIPAIRNWATDTWQSFAAQTEQQNNARNPTIPPELLNPQRTSSLSTPSNSHVALADQASTSSDRNSLPVSTPAATNEPIVTSPPVSTSGNQPANSTNTTESTPTANTAASTTPTSSPAAISTAVTTQANTDTTAALAQADPESAHPSLPAEPDSTADAMATPLPVKSTTPAATTTPAVTSPVATTPAPDAEGLAAISNPSADGSIAIRLEFIDEVWMEIRDINGKKLFSSLNSASTIKELRARPPLTFKIGNVHGVALYLNGQFYDTRAFAKGSTARFRVE